MSSYFIVHTKDKKMDLVVYSTSLARELHNLLNLKYGEEVELTEELLNSFIKEIEDKKKGFFSSKENCEKEIKELQEMLPKAVSSEIYSCMKEDISLLVDEMTFLKDEADKYQEVINDFKFLLNLLENNDNLELCYYFA